MSEHEHGPLVIPGHPCDHSGIVRESAIPVDLDEITEEKLEVVPEIGALRMPRHLNFLPRGEPGIDVPAHLLQLFLKLRDLLLLLRVFGIAGKRLDLLLKGDQRRFEAVLVPRHLVQSSRKLVE